MNGAGDSARDEPRIRPVRRSETGPGTDADQLLGRVALGDEPAFEELYDLMSAKVYGLCVRVLRDPAQAEEIAQEVFVEVWRKAARFDPSRGSASTWILTVTHRRAVDRVRSSQAAADRERRVVPGDVDYDQVSEIVTDRLEHRQVRRCLERLTEIQRQAITLAFYGGHTYRQVGDLLGTALPTVKTRIRDGLIRLRDCLEVIR
ncbi:ECF RNA polymerase sigma factor SigK [Stackebrandtia soli]|uniref:ECF RNA polymerase sigma factor SigK n=1 Tax=Stackebrandtia soli TaxID=1892856 RepID=UPI0039E82C15